MYCIFPKIKKTMHIHVLCMCVRVCVRACCYKPELYHSDPFQTQNQEHPGQIQLQSGLHPKKNKTLMITHTHENIPFS